MSYQYISVTCENHITRITFERPEVMNAINPAMHEELQVALDAFAVDGDQYVAVLTGRGDRAFCAGSDLKAMAAEKDRSKRKYPKNGYAGLIERFDLDKPLIAAVNGICMGGGFEIALACDIIIATENARFALPEPRVGAVALGGGLHRLPRQIGLKRAMGLILTGRHVTAAEGERYSFVNEVVPAGALEEAIERWCADILRGAPLSVRASKATVMQGLDEPTLVAAIGNQANYAAYRRWWESEDRIEGPRAFAEKRTPDWKGR